MKRKPQLHILHICEICGRPFSSTSKLDCWCKGCKLYIKNKVKKK